MIKWNKKLIIHNEKMSKKFESKSVFKRVRTDFTYSMCRFTECRYKQ